MPVWAGKKYILIWQWILLYLSKASGWAFHLNACSLSNCHGKNCTKCSYMILAARVAEKLYRNFRTINTCAVPDEKR